MYNSWLLPLLQAKRIKGGAHVIPKIGLHVREAEQCVEECTGCWRGCHQGASPHCQAGAQGGRASCKQVSGNFAALSHILDGHNISRF